MFKFLRVSISPHLCQHLSLSVLFIFKWFVFMVVNLLGVKCYLTVVWGCIVVVLNAVWDLSSHGCGFR